MKSAVTSTSDITQSILDSINVEQSKNENKTNLEKELGGLENLAASLGVDLAVGLSVVQVGAMRARFGDNSFPETPMESYLSMLLGALSDPVLLILIAAAAVSFAVGIYQHGAEEGWVEGGAIFIAVFLVSNIAAANDYSKQLQFQELENTSSKDERCSALRDGAIELINPKDLVVGDVLVMQAGDQVPADCIIFGNNTVLANEASLTGEPEDLKKSQRGDCFLLSSSLLTEGEEVRALVIGIGSHSQWGKIKENLVVEAVNTPLQDKLEDMTKSVSKLAAFVLYAFTSFTANICTNACRLIYGLLLMYNPMWNLFFRLDMEACSSPPLPLLP
jgi:Ca2+-transporting ATPase